MQTRTREELINEPLRRSRYFAHTVERAKKRYGIDLTRRGYNSLGKKIVRKDGFFMGRISTEKTVWGVMHGKIKMIVVYNNEFHAIETVLPFDGFHPANYEGIKKYMEKDRIIYERS